jgi:hypothetical protein
MALKSVFSLLLILGAATKADAAIAGPVEPQDAPPLQVILDTMDTSLTTHGVNVDKAQRACMSPHSCIALQTNCMNSSYSKQFHHDGSKNKGGASFTFAFNAPKSGCYKVDEYHPSGCSSYLPRNAKFDIERGRCPAQSYVINQAKNGGQWNEVGMLEFVSGEGAKLVMRNSKDEQCGLRDRLSKKYGLKDATDACFFVVDAFRLTWTADECVSFNAEASSTMAMHCSHTDTVMHTPSRPQDPGFTHASHCVPHVAPWWVSLAFTSMMTRSLLLSPP